MNEVEILEKINKLQKEINRLKQQFNGNSNERWTPIHGQEYYVIDSCGRADFNIYSDNGYDERVIDFRNCYQTKEEAEQENKGKKIDWEDENQVKYSICLDLIDDKISWDRKTLYISQGTIYCLDINFYRIAIQELGEERLMKYLRSE